MAVFKKKPLQKKRGRPPSKRKNTKQPASKTISQQSQDTKSVQELVQEAKNRMLKNSGRPSKYTKEMSLKILEMCANGMSLQNACTYLGICTATRDNWCNPNHSSFKSEFLGAVKLGRDLSELWWMEQGRRNIWNPKFNSVLYMMQMQNRFGWHRKLEGSFKTEHTEKKVYEVKLREDVESRAKVLEILDRVGALDASAAESSRSEME